MKKWMWWVLGLVVLPMLILAAIALALQRWVHSDDFRGFVSDQVSMAVGVPVELGSIDVDIWPLPAVALNNINVKSQPPLTLERIIARPSYAPLLQRRLEIKTVIVRNAVIPESAVAAIGVAFKKKSAQAPKDASADTSSSGVHVAIPKRIVLEGISWVSEKGFTTTVDALAQFDDDGLPESAKVEVKKGNLAGVQATLARETDHWSLRAQIGGGTINGKLTFDAGEKGSALKGEFDTKGVEISALTAPARTLTGKLDASTTLNANISAPGALVDAIRTQTKFTVRSAVVHGLDLAAAVKSVGINRGGETRLDALAGSVATQGRAVQLNNLVATSGTLSASGNIAMSPNKALSGRITVDLVSGAVGGALGIPLAVGGTLDSPSVALSRGALVGAAIGTVIAPGLGTGGGAKIGDKIGSGLKGLFGK
ncbi:MAG: hypothetical protein H7255_05895 [Ramlibacter sp.]|nr:hypothetical protein [Ramlibacter sp.]